MTQLAPKGAKMKADPFLHQPEHLQKFPVQPQQKFILEVAVTIPRRRSNGGYTKAEVKRTFQEILDREFSSKSPTASRARIRKVDLD